ncbi:MAG: serine/threonine protein kinase, partial [Vicinamibacteria bacterium]|nr:serine/threonine protein kinase [Vicinamibacteria bacterium]
QMNQRGGPLPLAMAAPLILQALDGLAHAHQKGFIHRDLKPENLLLADTAGRQIKISDFGLAKNFVVAGLSGMTATGDYAGTFSYMPREQITSFRALKPVSDVWSLGATLYFVLTGRHARDFGPDRDPLQVILGTPCVPIRNRDPRIPAAVAAVIDRALADTILERYASAEEFKLALERALQ